MSKNVIILGGSSGIGKATAERFAREGWSVMVAAPDPESCRDVVSRLGDGNHLWCPVDLRDDLSMVGLAAKVKDEWGSFQALVNSVGISMRRAVTEPDFAAWDEPLRVMLYGAVKSCRQLIPLLEDGGRIVHVTSIHDRRVGPDGSAYAMAKAAITQWTRALALELASRGILANTVAPGFVDTPMSVKEDGRNELTTAWFHDNYQLYGHLPLKRAAQPGEIAGVIYFLSGPDASYMTGSVLTVDGGLTITF